MSAVEVATGPRRRVATARLATFVGLLAGTGLALVAGAQPWWRALGAGVSVTFTGTDATAGLSQALALVVLAGTLLALALKVRGRRVLAVLLALAGAGAVVVGVSRPRPSATAVRSQVREVSLADQFALSGTAWPWVFAVAGLLVLAAALVMVRTASRWPVRTARYDRAATTTGPDLDDPVAVWRSMDAGVDPTLDPEIGTVAASLGGDVRESPAQDTMDAHGRDRPTARTGRDGPGTGEPDPQAVRPTK